MTNHAHHSHVNGNYNKAFAFGVGLNVIYILIEVTFGVISGSLALLADAGHNLSDVLGLLLAWGAVYLATVKPSKRRTYGWRNSSILAASFNGLILLIAVGGIIREAIHRFYDPQPITGSTVMLVAGAGVIINSLTASLFLRGRHDDLNIKGAFLHMAADAVVSLGVVLAGLVIVWTGWLWVDPLMSLVVAVVIFWSTWGLLRESMNLLLQAVPSDIDPDEVRQYLSTLPGVIEVHDLHIWGISTTETALTVHLVKPLIENEDHLLQEASQILHDRFGIEHTTIQFERTDDPDMCGQASVDSL